MSFRQFGGLNYAPKHNIVASNYNTTNELFLTGTQDIIGPTLSFPQIASGNVTTSFTSNNTNVNFPFTFGGVPTVIVCNAEGSIYPGYIFSVDNTNSSVTKSGCTVYQYPPSGGALQMISVNWIAIYQP
jgi:hypothetical protein